LVASLATLRDTAADLLDRLVVYAGPAIGAHGKQTMNELLRDGTKRIPNRRVGLPLRPDL
jgi:hypothetical protein